MSIINSTVTQGAEIKTSETASTTYIADEVIFSVGSVAVTQRQLITGAFCFLAAWALKD